MPKIGAVESYFLHARAVVDDDADSPPGTDQKLMTRAVRMLSAHVRAWHVVDEEVTLRREGQLARVLSRRQRASQIDGELHLVQRHARD